MTSSTARKLPAAASAVLDRLVLSIGTFNIACDGIQADRNPQTERTFRDAFAQVRDEMEGVNKLKTQYPELEDAATLAVNNHANKFASKILLQ